MNDMRLPLRNLTEAGVKERGPNYTAEELIEEIIRLRRLAEELKEKLLDAGGRP